MTRFRSQFICVKLAEQQRDELAQLLGRLVLLSSPWARCRCLSLLMLPAAVQEDRLLQWDTTVFVAEMFTECCHTAVREPSAGKQGQLFRVYT